MSEETVETNFDVLMPKPVKVTVYSRREIVEVMPIQLIDIPAVAHECAPVVEQLRKLKTTTDLDSSIITTLVLDNITRLPRMLAACTGRPIEFFSGDGADVKALQTDEYMALVSAVLEKNVDFFTQRLLPFVLQAKGLLAVRLRKPAPVKEVVGTKAASTGAQPSKP